MVLFGASGHAKVIIDILEKNEVSIHGLYDEDEQKKELLGYKVLGKTADFSFDQPSIVSIGDNHTRELVVKRIQDADFGNAIHPASILGQKVSIGPGTVVMAGVVVNSCTTIGMHAILNTGSSVDHDCVIEDFAHVAPNAVICGGVHVGKGTLVGAGATIIPSIRIGKNCVIGAGAVVVNDVEDNSTVVGNPAKRIKK